MPATPGFTLVLHSDLPDGVLVWADDEIGYELVGTNTGADPLDLVTITDDLTDVLTAAVLADDPLATITHADGSSESAALAVRGGRLTWAGQLEVGASVRITYVVVVGLVAEATTLHNVASATWTPADGSSQVTQTAEASNPVNPVAIAGVQDESDAGSDKTLANTGFSASANLLAFAGLFILLGVALLAVRRSCPARQPRE